jgi:hypothetical protein
MGGSQMGVRWRVQSRILTMRRERTNSSPLGRCRFSAGRVPSGYCRGHRAEPADLALAKAREFAAGHSPADFCNDCGRRLALATIQWSDWVLRRVEKVRFRDDRSVNYQISIDFLVREDAPLYEGSGGRWFWLVPMSIMRRKTLVNFDLRDEEGRSIPLPGLRLTQHFDECLLRAIASIELNHHISEEAGKFIHEVVGGELVQVKSRMESLRAEDAPADIMELIRKDGIFNVMLHRLSYHYILYTFIEAEPRRRHRILRMSVDEPLTLYHRRPGLLDPRDATKDKRTDTLSYKRRSFVPKWSRHRVTAALGWTPTRVRFPVPTAENTTSFHFEIEAPPGVDIVEASILAGVPDEGSEESRNSNRPSFDRSCRPLPTVGLHVTGVPNGSSSRAQVDLQVATRGWYTMMLLSCWATFLWLAAILWHAHTIKAPADTVAVLAGVAAAVATVIAQGEFRGMAGRLLGLARALAAVEAVLPLIVATLFVFNSANRFRELSALTFVAGIITLAISISWLRARLRLGSSWLRTRLRLGPSRLWGVLPLRSDQGSGSPWEMAADLDPLTDPPKNFWEAARKYGYTAPAIRVDSAEGWHEEFRWTEKAATSAEMLRFPIRRQ